MSKNRKVIITCAVTGSIHTPSMSPHLPLTPAQIAAEAIAAAEAGAAIVHLHARQPEDGRPSQDPALFQQFLPQIKAASDVVVNITTGGAATINGDDAIELFNNGSVVDTYGQIDVNGDGTPWDYTDGWAYRNNGTAAAGLA